MSASSATTSEPTTTETFSNQWFSATFFWRSELLTSIELTPTPVPETQPCSPWGTQLATLIQHYDQFTTDSWPNLPLEPKKFGSFTRIVLETLRTSISRGSSISYGVLALRCGSPRAARAVGSAMATNPWPLYVPCHRVVRANGNLGNYGPGPELKRTLLTLEGALG